MKEQILEIKRELLLLKKNDIDFFLRGQVQNLEETVKYSNVNLLTVGKKNYNASQSLADTVNLLLVRVILPRF